MPEVGYLKKVNIYATHHGIYIGAGMVVHYYGFTRDTANIICTTLE